MRRLTITIPDDAAKALVGLARLERRDPRAQAAVLLTEVLIDRAPVDDHDAATETRTTDVARPERQAAR